MEKIVSYKSISGFLALFLFITTRIPVGINKVLTLYG